MEIIIWLVVALAVVVLVGHLGWVMIRGIFRLLFKPRPAPIAGFCPRCRKADMRADGSCRTCGWPNEWAAEASTYDDDLKQTARQIFRLLEEGLIDANTHARVIDAIRAARERMPPSDKFPLPLPGALPHDLPPIPVIPLARATAVPISAQDAIFRPPPATDQVSIGILAPDHPLAPIPAPPRPIPPAAPKRSIAEMFASFMESSNIRWGELLGGLLIVGCSVALVVSFWTGIERQPWLQFAVFTAVTAACFGLGLYTEHRWKLPTTSRGILLIATLLVPLNFLGFAAFSAGHWPACCRLPPRRRHSPCWPICFCKPRRS